MSDERFLFTLYALIIIAIVVLAIFAPETLK